MAFLNTGRLLIGTAVSLVLMASGGAWAQGTEAEKVETFTAPPFVANNVDTFAGAFLAARTADNDYDYETAIKLYRIALKFEPDNIDVRERLMVSLFMNGEFDEGVKQAEVLKDDPSVERIATIARSIDMIRKKDYENAYKLLAYNGPNELDRMINLLLTAWGQYGEGKTQEALKTINGMKGPDWYSVFVNYSAGVLAAAAGEDETARRKLTDAVANRDQGIAASDLYMRSVMALATLEAKAGNKRKALDAVAAGEAFAPGYMPLQAFRTLIEEGKVPDLPVMTVEDGMASVLFGVGGALNQSLSSAPDRQSAQDIVAFYLVTAYALDPDAADTVVLLGGLAERQDLPNRAIFWYRKVPKDSPLSRISELQLGLNLANTGQIEDARTHLKAAIEADPNDIRGYIAYGSLLSDQKEYAEMAKIYDKAVEVIGPIPKRTDWSVFFQRGIAYERLKRWSDAEPNFKKALELFPDQPQVLNYLGYSWVDMNIHLDQGLDMIRKAVNIRPDDGYIVDSLGWAYYRLNRFEDAVAELERAVELKAADATINDHLGDAYWRVGRKLEAIFQWQTTLDLKPEAAEIPKIKKKLKEGLPPLDQKSEATISGAQETDIAALAPATRAVMPKAAADSDDLTVEMHKVSAGETLWTIARDRLGDGNRFREIIELNPDLQRNPDRLKPGSMLRLPQPN